MNEKESEITAPDADPVIFIIPTGFFPGIAITYEQIQRIQAAEDERQREKDRKKKPPKPPNRPNARIGGLALGNS